MSFLKTTAKLLRLSETILKWHGSLTDLQLKQREKLAKYADEIAGCLARCVTACRQLADTGDNRAAALEVVRELGRMKGYVEDVTEALQDHLDGRKIAGVKRRLESLTVPPAKADGREFADPTNIERLLEAEGYIRSLADRLRI